MECEATGSFGGRAELRAPGQADQFKISTTQREQVLALATDFPRLWNFSVRDAQYSADRDWPRRPPTDRTSGVSTRLDMPVRRE
jgi:hypothetical protein